MSEDALEEMMEEKSARQDEMIATEDAIYAHALQVAEEIDALPVDELTVRKMALIINRKLVEFHNDDHLEITLVDSDGEPV
jgi:hypothetical protein